MFKAVILMTSFVAAVAAAQQTPAQPEAEKKPASKYAAPVQETPPAGDTEKKPASAQAVAEKKAPAEPTAEEILREANRALVRTQLVKYKAVCRGTGWMTDRSPVVEGSAVVGGMSEEGLDKFRVDATLKTPAEPASNELRVASDGHMYYFADPDSKTFHASTDPKTIGGRGNSLKAIAFPYFSHPFPLRVEMAMDRATLLGTVDVEGEECYEIHLSNVNDTMEAFWCFSKSDLLPRKRVMVFEDLDGEKATISWTFSQMEVDPKFEDNPFKPDVPEGYTKTDAPAE